MEKRIYQIAKELNISHIQILKFLESKSIKVPNHMAFVNNDIYDSNVNTRPSPKNALERNTNVFPYFTESISDYFNSNFLGWLIILF